MSRSTDKQNVLIITHKQLYSFIYWTPPVNIASVSLKHQKRSVFDHQSSLKLEELSQDVVPAARRRLKIKYSFPQCCSVTMTLCEGTLVLCCNWEKTEYNRRAFMCNRKPQSCLILLHLDTLFHKTQYRWMHFHTAYRTVPWATADSSFTSSQFTAISNKKVSLQWFYIG